MEEGYAKPLDNNSAQALADRLRASPRYSHLSREELVERLEGVNQSLYLEWLLGELLHRASAEHSKRFRDAYVGAMPLRGIQAYSLLSESKGVLIVLNHDLTIVFLQWARVVADLFMMDLGSTEAQALTAELKDSIKVYSEGLRLPDFKHRAATSEARSLSLLFLVRAVEFVLAHEFGHALLGHLRPQTGPVATYVPRTDFRDEVDADLAGFNMLIRSYLERGLGDKESFRELDTQVAGAFLAISLLEFMEFVEFSRKPAIPTTDRTESLVRSIYAAVDEDNTGL